MMIGKITKRQGSKEIDKLAKEEMAKIMAKIMTKKRENLVHRPGLCNST
jgi:hypothetical protein